jgi:flagellar hook-associated protein 1 FlgK
LQGASDDPTSIPQRQLLLTQTEGLASRFHSLNSRFVSQGQAINQKIISDVGSINSMATSIAQLNEKIAIAIGAGQGSEPNDLMDQRDETLRKLSEKVNVHSVAQGDGRINVYIGTGQPIVLGNQANELTISTSPDDASRLEVAYKGKKGTQIISDQITGGQLGGTLDFRDNVLNPAINTMGRIAIAMSDTINKQHQKGMDLKGDLGGNFFTDINTTSFSRGRVQGNYNNVPPANQVLRVDIKDASQLTTDNYGLEFTGPTVNDYKLVRKPSNSIIQQGVLPNTLPASINADGFNIVLESGTYNVGDKFLIQPTKNGAQDIGLAIDRVEKLAFASPIRAKSSLGNRGAATISQGEMLDVKNPQTNQTLSAFSVPGKLSPPMAVRFTTDTRYDVLDVSDPANPKPLVPPLNNQLYNPAIHNQLFTDDPGATSVSASGSNIATLPAPTASPGPYNNGYGAQNLTVLTRDPTSGVVTSQTVAIAANDSADVIATKMNAVQGMEANAYSQVNIRNFVDNGDANPLGLKINGETLTVPAPGVFGPDELANVINSNSALKTEGFYASSSGTGLTVKSTKGVDIKVEVTGTGDSVTVDKVSPYTGSVLASQNVTSGNGIAVGGFLDVSMGNGVSMSANVDSVFQMSPSTTSSYIGFKMDIIGDAKQGDKFNIDYNTGGYSDNRNAQALSNLQTKGIIGNGVSTFSQGYSTLVETIGTTTSQARIDQSSSKTLLQQSTSKKSSVSGVNLDEEAGRLIQFQAAYNASAQLISITRNLFDKLLGTFQ